MFSNLVINDFFKDMLKTVLAKNVPAKQYPVAILSWYAAHIRYLQRRLSIAQ